MIHWKVPWIALVLTSAFAILLNPLLAVLEGCGLIVPVSLVRTYQNVFNSVVLWGVLAAGGSLYAASISTVFAVMPVLFFLWRYRACLLDLLSTARYHPDNSLNWWGEVWPFQWKIAVASISGYFVFAFFNPVMFAFHGAVAAGRMGMSLTVMNALAGATAAWVGTKLPTFGALIARRDWNSLDRLFFPALWRSVLLLALGSLAFWALICILDALHLRWGARVLEPWPLMLLVIATIANQVTGLLGAYLRAHKREPFLVISIVLAVLTVLSTFALGKHFAALGMMAGYCGVGFIGLAVGTQIFLKLRSRWHLEPLPTDESAPQDDAVLAASR